MLKYDWDGETEQEQVNLIETAGFGAMRITLLFGTAAVALAIILVPLINRATGDGVMQARSRNIDTIITGSTSKYKNEFSVRRSVLQDDVTQPCVIYADGRESGGC